MEDEVRVKERWRGEERVRGEGGEMERGKGGCIRSLEALNDH